LIPQSIPKIHALAMAQDFIVASYSNVVFSRFSKSLNPDLSSSIV
jgi:hypothetical protein